jgi:hypothetical protein
MKHQQTNHRKTFNKLKKQTHLLKWKQDQIDSEIHQVWVQEKKRLTSNIAFDDFANPVANSIPKASQPLGLMTMPIDFFDLQGTKENTSKSITTKLQTTYDRKQDRHRTLLNCKDWKDSISIVASNYKPSATIPKAAHVSNNSSFTNVVNVKRFWKNKALLTKHASSKNSNTKLST